MKLEEAIKQNSPFRNERQKLVVNMIYTYGWLKEKMATFFSEFDLTLKQYNILRILRGAGKPVSTQYIRERMLDRMSDTSRIIDRMVRKGIVLKKVCEKDKRLIDISISDKGHELLARTENHVEKMDEIFSSLNQEELKKLNDLLDKSRSIIH